MASASQPSSRMSWLTDLLLLGIALTVFYYCWLGSYPLFTPDEGRYAEAAREMLVSGDFITPRVNGVAFLDKPALYYWLQAASMHLFGVNEWAIRFFPALFGIEGCLAVYLAGRQLFGRQTGLLSAIILAATPLYYCCAHYANLDLEVAVLISNALLLFLVATTKEGRTRTILFLGAYIVTGLAFLTKGLIALAFPVMIAGLWIVLLSRWRLLCRMHLIAGMILIALITAPWLILVQRANPEFLHYFFIAQQVTRFLSGATFNNPTPFWFYVPVIMAGFLPWTIFLTQALIHATRACIKARETHAPELFLLLWALIIFVFFSIPHSKTISYILPVLPALALLTGRYLAFCWHEASRSRGIKVSIALFIVMNTLFAAIFFALPKHWADMPVELMPTFLMAGIETALYAIILLLYYRQFSVARLFYFCTLASTILLLTVTHGAKHMNPNSAKPLIAPLQAVMQPQDTVVNYFKFYQDVPLYLGRTILLVADWQSPTIAERDNWVREMWYSMPFQATDDILLTEKIFWKRWHSREHLFVFINNNYLEQFEAQAGQYYLIAKHRDIILVSNQPTKTGH